MFSCPEFVHEAAVLVISAVVLIGLASSLADGRWRAAAAALALLSALTLRLTDVQAYTPPRELLASERITRE